MNLSQVVDHFQSIKIFDVAIGLLVIVLAIIYGLLATSAQPLAIALGAALIIGSFLLIRPKILISAVLILGLVSGVFVSLAGSAFSKLGWIVSGLSFVLMAIGLLRLPGTKNLPFFFWLTMAFMILAIATTLLQLNSAIEFLAGFKRYFQAFGLFIALTLLTLTSNDVKRWRNLVFAIALLQLPSALFEFLVLVPLRGGLGAPGSTDVVAGTFEANLVGGSANAPMVAFLIMILAFVIARWIYKLIPASKLALYCFPFVIPLFLGESKIVLVMLPLIFAVSFREQLFRRPILIFLSLLFGGILLFILGYIYAEIYIGKSLDWVIKDTAAYNFGDRGYGSYYLNRTTVLSFWWSHQGLQDPIGFFVGHGIGSAFSSTTTLVPGHMAFKWPNYGIGLTSASTLLWDTGILGFALYLSIFLSAWITCNSIRRNAREIWMQADALAIQSSISVLILLLFYQDYLVNYLQLQLIMMAILGYLAYMYQTQRIQPVYDPRRFPITLPDR